MNPSWLAARPLHNVVLQTDPANHPRPSLADDKPPPPLDDKLAVPRPIHITALEIPATYQAILKTVPGLHLRPPVLPEKMRAQALKPPDNGYDFMFHIGLAGRGPLRLERCGHKLGYNMKDASGHYAPVVIARPKGFSRRAPDGRPMTIAEKAERDRLSLVAASEMQSNPPGDSNAKPNRGFGGPSYEIFSDELNTDLDVTRIVQDLRQTGVEVSLYDYLSASTALILHRVSKPSILLWMVDISWGISSITVRLQNPNGARIPTRNGAILRSSSCIVLL